MSNAKSWSVLAGGVAAWLGLVATGFASDRADDVPRYRLQVGQELTYRGKNVFKYQRGGFISGESWKIWVVAENSDKSWRLILRHGSSFKQVRGNDEKIESESDTSAVQEEVTFAWCDFHSDGRIIENDTFGFRMQPSNLFVKLPADSSELKQGWVSYDARMGETCKLSMSGESSAERCAIAVSHESPMDEIYGSESHDVLTFDKSRGIPERIDSENSQTYGFNGKGKGSVELVSVKASPGEVTAKFAEECERYFQANAEFKQATDREELEEDELKAAVAKAIEKLNGVKDAIENKELKKLIEDQVTNQKQMTSQLLDSAKKRRAILGTKSDLWQTTDLEGKKHSLEDYRGKVVILDFWYRGCGWCIRAMPQVKEVAAHFADKPVVVFGMNTDRKEEDATFVVEKMRLNYANLKAQELPSKYNVSGFPTLIILDQKGVIRDLQVGYSPDLKEKVTKSVERLLAEDP